MKRRTFLHTAITGGNLVMTGLIPSVTAGSSSLSTSGSQLPYVRGFNLMEKLQVKDQHGQLKWGKYTPYRESDFEIMAEWGFDLARLPMDSHCWIDDQNPAVLDERALSQIDQAVAWGQDYGIHVSLNMYHAPGYRMGWDIRPDLWHDEALLNQFVFYWTAFADRYKGIPPSALSFHLLNEPGKMFGPHNEKGLVTPDVYQFVVNRTVHAIRSRDPERLIIVDGLRWAQEPVAELLDLQVAQSLHCFEPKALTMYHPQEEPVKAGTQTPEPTWPLYWKGKVYDRSYLDETVIQPWKKLQEQGVGVQVSAWGILDTVPHQIALAWTQDCLELWKDAGWGWALWNLRGEHGYGILDTHRQDVQYEDYKGHKLDRAMLELLRAF